MMLAGCLGRVISNEAMISFVSVVTFTLSKCWKLVAVGTHRTSFFDGLSADTESQRTSPQAHIGPAATLRTSHHMETEVNVLALVKGEEKFIFLFDDENCDETLRQLARFAANPDLDFSWYDAAMLSRKIRETVADEVSAIDGTEELASEEFDTLSIDDFA